MDSKRKLQQAFGLAIVALLLAGCVGAESMLAATTVVPTNTPIPPETPPPPTAGVPTEVPTETPKPTPFVPLPTPTLNIDTSVQMEQAIVGVWVNSPEDVHNRRYHVYTGDGKFCAGNYLPPLLEGDPRSCKAYEVNGNILSETCAEGSVGCTVGDVCEVEVHIMDNGWLHYFVPEPCPTFMAGHPVVGDPEIFFMREEEMTPTPDTSIVWSDDFDDGDSDGWEPGWRPGKYSVNDSVLSFTDWGGDVEHPSTVLYGTWSLDTYIGDNSGTTHEFRFTEGIYNYQMLEIKQSPNTQIWISTQQDPDHLISSYVDLGEKLTGWHHLDITKDKSGWIKVYLDGEFVVEHFDDIPFDAVSVVFNYCCKGPALDNVVVRNQIIDIQPSE